MKSISNFFANLRRKKQQKQYAEAHRDTIRSTYLLDKTLSLIHISLNANAAEAGKNVFETVKLWQVLVCLPVGYIVGVTQVVPGLSATAVLMALGWFKSLLDSVSLSFWHSNPMIFAVYAALVVGFLLGLFTFSRFLTYMFGKARHTAYSMIVGLSLGSIVSMLDVYKRQISSCRFCPAFFPLKSY